MVRLISLKLQPVSRPVDYLPLSSPTFPTPPIPAKSSRRTEPQMLPALPSSRTQAQWRVALDQVRATYLRKQYKECTVRCLQLLGGAPDMLLPLHCIYLSFYAAICFELLARLLPNGSHEKLPLFNLARVYYEKTEQYMWEAESGLAITNSELAKRAAFEVHTRFSSSSSNSSAVSPISLASPISESAHSLPFSSPMHSPASSVCSSSYSKSADEAVSGDTLKPRPLRVKKTVSFHLQDIEIEPPTSALSHSLARCSTHLLSLRTQLTHHLSTITALTSALQNIQSNRCRQSLSSDNHSAAAAGGHSGSVSNHYKRSNLPTAFDDYRDNSNKISTFPLRDVIESGKALRGEAGDQAEHGDRNMDRDRAEKAQRRKARIAQLKRRGEEWRTGRGRFNSMRYENLCVEALRELELGL